jgi:hypothetical protein
VFVSVKVVTPAVGPGVIWTIEDLGAVWIFYRGSDCDLGACSIGELLFIQLERLCLYVNLTKCSAFIVYFFCHLLFSIY